MKNIAIILAGGTGSRVGGNTPKQFLPLEDGRSVLEHAIDAFEAASSIDEIAVVIHPEWIEEAEALREKNKWKKVMKVIPGGTERWESSYNAIKAYEDQDDVALWLHDAARPFVSQAILANIAEALKKHVAVTVAIPVTDTLYRVESQESIVESIPSRSEFMRAQTPQAFHLNTIKTAYEKALASGNIIATDDAGILHKYMPDTPIYIVSGDESNRKITYREDL